MQLTEFREYLAVWEAEAARKTRRDTKYVRKTTDGRLVTTWVPNDREIPAANVRTACDDLEIPLPPDLNDRLKNVRGERRDSPRKPRD